MALGRLDIIMAADMAQLRKDMSSAVNIMQSTTNTMKDVAKTAASAMVGYFSFDLFKTQIQETLQFADSLSKLSQKTGITADGLYSLSAAAKLSDVDFASLENSLAKFSKGIGEASMGTGSAKDAFERLGLSIKNQDGTLKDSFALLTELSDKFQDMPNGASKATTAMELFGKSGADIIPLLNSGSDALKEYLGVMDSETGKAAEAFNDSMTKIGLAFSSVKMSIIKDFSPSIQGMTEDIESVAKSIQSFSSNSDINYYETFKKYADDVAALGVALYGTPLLIKSTSNAFSSLSSSTMLAAAKMALYGNELESAIAKTHMAKSALAGLSMAFKTFVPTAALFAITEIFLNWDEITGKVYDNLGKISNFKIQEMIDKQTEYIKTLEDRKRKGEDSNGFLAFMGASWTNMDDNTLRFAKQELQVLESQIRKNQEKDKNNQDKKKNDYGVIDTKELDTQVKEYLSIYSSYYEAIGDKATAWAIKEHELREKNKILSEEQINSLLDAEKKKYFELSGEAKKHADEAKKLAEETAKFNDEQFALLAQNSEKSIRQLDSAIDFEELNKNAIKAISDYNNSYITYYEAIGNESKAYYFKEELEIERLKELKILSDLEINEIITKNREKFRDEQFKEENKWLYDYFDNINKALDNSLLDGFKTKFSNFGDWLENLFGSIGDSIFASLSRSFAGSITSSLQTSIVGAMQGGNYARGVATLASGATLSNASEADSTLGGLSALSSLKTAYDVLSGGISGTLLNGFNSVANMTGIGGISQFGYGFANPFGNPLAGLYGSGVPELSGLASYGSMASAGLLGGGIGYGVGSLGDKLLGANSYAGVGGALGGATGGVLASLGVVGGPLGIIAGSLIGSALGGIFGKKTETDRGYNFLSDAYSNNIDVMGYSDWKKKGWFSSSKGSDPFELTATQKKEIEGIFQTYDYLLLQLGDMDKIILETGKYSGETFKDEVAKKFITAFSDVSQSTDDTIYQAWKSYAESVDKTVIEALTESVNAYIASMRDFETWALNRSGNGLEALAKQSQWLTEDFNNLAKMVGAVGVTVENYTAKYKEAVENSFDPTTITQWQQLGTALKGATEAADAYKNAVISSLTNEMNAWVTALGSVQGAIDALSPSFKSLDELKSASLSLDNYSTLLSQLEATRQNEINTLTKTANERIEQLNNEKTLFLSLSDYVDELNLKLMGSSALTSDYFFNELDRAKATFASGGIVDTSKLTQSASTYLDSALQNSTSQLEYFREIAKVKDGLGSLGSMVTGGTLHSVEAAIKAEEQTLASKLDELNQTALAILQGWKGTATSNISSLAGQINTVKTVDPIITQAYANILGRTPEAEGGAYWQSQLTSGNASTSNITSFIAEAAVKELYQTVLGREADANGLSYWQNLVTSGSINPTQIDDLFKEAAKIEINGSHATGLNYVPFDGYIAQLHKGERVQTASEVQKDALIKELKNEIRDLKEITIKTAAESTRTAKLLDRLSPDGDALQVRITA